MLIDDNSKVKDVYISGERAWTHEPPLCTYCDEYIDDVHFYMVNDECICKNCMDTYFKKNTKDFIE